MNKSRIAVVVVTFNSAPLLSDLIASLPAGLAGCDWQLVVADNASADDTVSRLAELAPAATLVQTGRNAGYAAGINAGVAAADDFDYVFVMNPDVRLAPDCAAKLIQALHRPGVGIAVPWLDDSRGHRMNTQRRAPAIRRALADALIGATQAGRLGTLGEVVSDASMYERETAIEWPEGSTMLISRACWDACQGWDESYFLYSEETEYALRAGDLGYRTWFSPAARAVHLKGESTESPALWALLSINKVKLFRSRHNAARSGVFWAAVLLRELSRAALGKRTSKAAARALTSPRLMQAERTAELLPELS